MNKNFYKHSILVGVIYLILFTLVPMVIVWVMLGEFNKSGLNWMWISNKTNSLEVSYKIFLVMFALLFFNILFYILLIKFKIASIKIFSFIVGVWFLLFAIICSGMIFPKDNSDFSWIIIVRALIAIVSYIIGFIASNFILNKILPKTKLGELYARQLIKEEQKNERYIIKNIKNLKDKFKKNSNKKEEIEIKK